MIKSSWVNDQRLFLRQVEFLFLIEMKTRETATIMDFNELFSQESEAWLRELDFLLMEVSFLKTRLSHVVDVASGRDTILEAEAFQSGFITTEDSVRRLVAEVKFQIEQVNYSKGIKDQKQEKKVSTAQEYLRAAMMKLEKEFSEMRRRFNQWVIGNIRVN